MQGARLRTPRDSINVRGDGGQMGSVGCGFTLGPWVWCRLLGLWLTRRLDCHATVLDTDTTGGDRLVGIRRWKALTLATDRIWIACFLGPLLLSFSVAVASVSFRDAVETD